MKIKDTYSNCPKNIIKVGVVTLLVVELEIEFWLVHCHLLWMNVDRGLAKHLF
jgi:hypothetical protein